MAAHHSWYLIDYLLSPDSLLTDVRPEHLDEDGKSLLCQLVMQLSVT
jgi:hypothetical protein